MINIPIHWSVAMPAFRRLMMFIDGENMVFRYQSMLAKGWTPRDDDVCHIPDVLIWHSSFSQLVRMDEVIRATYYTYVVGDENRLTEVRNLIRTLSFSNHRNSALPNTLTPIVFKKSGRSTKAKGVDIQMTVDILTHVHRDNVDTVLLLSGDGDYIPVIQEVLRCGKQCYVSAFSDGLHHDLPLIADQFYCLDGTMFPSGRPE
jgi:uncharacterized LabA/DUF88 family protein